MDVVRPCTPADLLSLQTSWPVPGDVHRAHLDHQETGRSCFLVAWRGADAVGTVVLEWPSSGPGADSSGICPRLCHLQVRDGHRRRGVGTALVEAVLDEAAVRGFRCIVLSVGIDNLAARELYLRLGFEPTGMVERSEYEWVDHDGVRHPASELDEVFVKRLDSGA